MINEYTERRRLHRYNRIKWDYHQLAQVFLSFNANYYIIVIFEKNFCQTLVKVEDET